MAKKRQKKKNGRGGARVGAGRPPLLKGARPITILLDGRDLDRLAKLADARRVSLAAYVRSVLAQHLRGRRKSR